MAHNLNCPAAGSLNGSCTCEEQDEILPDGHVPKEESVVDTEPTELSTRERFRAWFKKKQQEDPTYGTLPNLAGDAAYKLGREQTTAMLDNAMAELTEQPEGCDSLDWDYWAADYAQCTFNVGPQKDPNPPDGCPTAALVDLDLRGKNPYPEAEHLAICVTHEDLGWIFKLHMDGRIELNGDVPQDKTVRSILDALHRQFGTDLAKAEAELEQERSLTGDLETEASSVRIILTGLFHKMEEISKGGRSLAKDSVAAEVAKVRPFVEAMLEGRSPWSTGGVTITKNDLQASIGTLTQENVELIEINKHAEDVVQRALDDLTNMVIHSSDLGPKLRRPRMLLAGALHKLRQTGIEVEGASELSSPTLRCTCDDNCDDPCPKHKRKNELQDLWLKEQSLSLKLGADLEGECAKTADLRTENVKLRLELGTIEEAQAELAKSVHAAVIQLRKGRSVEAMVELAGWARWAEAVTTLKEEDDG